MKFFKHKMILSVWLLSIMLLVVLYYFIPYIIKKDVRTLLVDNAQQMVQQMKLTRSYYLKNIVNDIQKDSNHFNFVARHKDNPRNLPLPSTLIHDLSELYTQETGIKFRTYSAYPFKNRIDRVLSQNDKKVLQNIYETSNGTYIFESNTDKPFLHVAIADYMENESCVKCHNTHPDRTWQSSKWKIGDIRGVIEISTPLKKPFIQLEHIKKTILGSILFLGFILIIYYSIIFLKREDELLKLNRLLDQRVKEEIEKNKEKEQILIQKSKLSSMGEMLNNISHQWRQPLSELSSVLMHIDIKYQNKQLDNHFMKKKMHKAENILEYLSHTIDDFKNFFAPSKEKESFSLLETIRHTFQIYDLKSSVDISIDIPKELSIFGFKTELSQVILNMISNAKEAHEKQQTLDPYIHLYTKQEEKNITLHIEDNAGGIKTTPITQIFTLYYTNKEEGSGIGLYMSMLIIEKHFNGSIAVVNTPKGCHFKLTFPLVSAANLV